MEKDLVSLQKMQVISGCYLAVLTLGSLLLFSWAVAWSALAGGAIALLSFWASHRDLTSFLGTLNVGPDLDKKQAKAVFSKSGVLLRFWIRFVIIGVVVLLFIKYSTINTFGLIMGLSTIVFTVTFTAVDIVRRYYFSGRR